jgi:hypothetical protein
VTLPVLLLSPKDNKRSVLFPLTYKVPVQQTLHNQYVVFIFEMTRTCRPIRLLWIKIVPKLFTTGNELRDSLISWLFAFLISRGGEQFLESGRKK